MPIASEHIRLMMMKRAAAAKDPGAEAMASAAKQAPSATPIPTMVPPADPAAAGAGDGGQREAQLQRELERKDKELSSLRNNNQVLNVQMAHLKSMAELEKRKAKELNDIDKREQKYRQTVAAEDAKMQQRKEQMTAAEVKHQAQLEIDTANHRAQLAEDKANQQASLAQSQAQTVAQDARRNAQEYVRMAEDARNEADKHMLNKEKNITGMQKELYTREKMEDDRNNRAAMNQAKLEAQQQNQAQRLQLNQQNQEQRMQMAQRKAMRAEQQQDAAREQKQMMQQQMPQPQTPQMGKVAAAAPAPAPAQPAPQPAQAPAPAPQQTPAPAPQPAAAASVQAAPAPAQPAPASTKQAPAKPAAKPNTFATGTFKRNGKFSIPTNIGAQHDIFRAGKKEMEIWGNAVKYSKIQDFYQKKAETAMAAGDRKAANIYRNKWSQYEVRRQKAIMDGTAAWHGRMYAQSALIGGNGEDSAARLVSLQNTADSIKAYERAGKNLTPEKRMQMNAMATAAGLLKGHYERVLKDPYASPQAKLSAKANLVTFNEYTAKRPQGLWSGMKYGVGQAVSGISKFFGGDGKTGSDWGQYSQQDEVLSQVKDLEESKSNIFKALANGQSMENAGQEMREGTEMLGKSGLGNKAIGLSKLMYGGAKGLAGLFVADPIKEVSEGIYNVPAKYRRGSNVLDQFQGVDKSWLWGLDGKNEAERRMAEKVMENLGLEQSVAGSTLGAVTTDVAVPALFGMTGARGVGAVGKMLRIPGAAKVERAGAAFDRMFPEAGHPIKNVRWRKILTAPHKVALDLGKETAKSLRNPATMTNNVLLALLTAPMARSGELSGDASAMGNFTNEELQQFYENLTPAQKKQLEEDAKLWRDAKIKHTDLWKKAAAGTLYKQASTTPVTEGIPGHPSAPKHPVPRTQVTIPGGGEQAPQEIVYGPNTNLPLPSTQDANDPPVEMRTGGPIAQNAQERNMGYSTDNVHTMTATGRADSLTRNPWVQMGLNMIGLGMNATPAIKRVGEVPINLDVLATAPDNGLEMARRSNPYGVTAEGARLLQTLARPKSDFSMYNYGNYFTR